MRVADFIAKFLDSHGIRHVFELTGGMIVHLLDSIYLEGKTKIISMHHEQAAAFAAEASARMTGVPGVALATSGPGAINLLTGIGSCFFDSYPCVFITGQVNSYELKKDPSFRQMGFQETDIVSMAQPITKAAWRVYEAEKIPEVFENAFRISQEGRPGPVLIDIAMDVQRAVIQINTDVTSTDISTSRQEDNIGNVIDDLIGSIQNSEKPLILAGGGVLSSRSLKVFRSVVQKLNVPVVNSLMAVDALPYDHPLRFGMIGSYGNRWANYALGNCDLLLVLGSRLDIRQTGAIPEQLALGKRIYHVDIEERQINARVTGCVSIPIDLISFFSHLTKGISQTPFALKSDWTYRIQSVKSEFPDTEELKGIEGINPNEFIHRLSAVSRAATAIVTDVGQHQMWSAQSIELSDRQRFLTSGGMGSMGFAIPAAIGASLSSGSKPVLAIAGDGGMQVNMQEFQTIVRNRLPIKIVVLDNSCLGMVRQFQESYFESRFQSTQWGYSAPEFTKIADAYGIQGKLITTTGEIDPALEWLWKDTQEPALLHVMINPNTNVYPKLAFGRKITDMEPLVKSKEME